MRSRIALALVAASALFTASCFGTLHKAVHLPPGTPDPGAPPEPYEPWEPEPGAPAPRKLEELQREREREPGRDRSLREAGIDADEPGGRRTPEVEKLPAA